MFSVIENLILDDRYAMNAIYSKFAGDEEWQELLDEFVAELPKRVAALDTALSTEDQPTLARLVHQLKGACGSYGFDEITSIASELEGVLQERPTMRNLQVETASFREALLRLTNRPAPCV